MKPIVVKNYFLNAEKYSMFGGSPSNSFFFDIYKSDKLKLNWDASANGSFNNSSFIAFDSLLLVADLSGRITSFNISNGKKNGEIKYSGGIEQAPIIRNSYLIFIVNEIKEKFSTLVVYDFVNGKEVSTLKINGKFRNELLYVKDHIFAISDFGKLHKFTGWGTLEWNKDLEAQVHSNPAGDEEYIYIATVDGRIIKVDAEEGNIILDKRISNSFQSGLTIDESYIYIGNNSGKLFSIDKNTLEIKWEFNSNSKIVQTPGYDNNNIYFGNLSGNVFSLDKKSGKNNWSYETNGLINASPIIFKNILIQPNLEKRIDIFDKSDGRLLNQILFDYRCRTTPLFYKNQLFIGVDKGEVFCYSFISNSLGSEE